VRQHVNPLSRYFQLPRDLPGVDDLFENTELPVHLDIGSARGKFLLDLAATQKDWNHIGVEIRRRLVQAANRDREVEELNNLCFLFCNANVSLEGWLSGLKIDKLQRVSIQFPDPWFKRRHRKRRVIQPSLVAALAEAMQPGRELFIQTDLLAVMEKMTEVIELINCFDLPDEKEKSWLQSNPFKIQTEREIYVEKKGLPVYRLLYVRNQKVVSYTPKLESELESREF